MGRSRARLECKSAAGATQNRGEPRARRFDCFEKGSEIGGNWRYMNGNGMSSAYRSLHINTSRDLMAYRTFPMPADYPDYRITSRSTPTSATSGSAGKISFRTEVTAVEPADGGGFSVTVRGLDDGAERTNRYDAVLVANGHHWDPRWPEPAFPGAAEFAGEQMHAHD